MNEMYFFLHLSTGGPIIMHWFRMFVEFYPLFNMLLSEIKKFEISNFAKLMHYNGIPYMLKCKKVYFIQKTTPPSLFEPAP